MIKKRSDLLKVLVRDENLLYRLLAEQDQFWSEYVLLLIDQKDLDEKAIQWQCPSESLILREVEDTKNFEVFWKNKLYLVVNDNKILFKKGSDF